MTNPDDLARKVDEARDILKAAIRKARDAHTKAKIELDLLFELEAMLNFDAIKDAIAQTPGDSNG